MCPTVESLEGELKKRIRASPSCSKENDALAAENQKMNGVL